MDTESHAHRPHSLSYILDHERSVEKQLEGYSSVYEAVCSAFRSIDEYVSRLIAHSFHRAQSTTQALGTVFPAVFPVENVEEKLRKGLTNVARYMMHGDFAALRSFHREVSEALAGMMADGFDETVKLREVTVSHPVVSDLLQTTYADRLMALLRCQDANEYQRLSEELSADVHTILSDTADAVAGKLVDATTAYTEEEQEALALVPGSIPGILGHMPSEQQMQQLFDPDHAIETLRDMIGLDRGARIRVVLFGREEPLECYGIGALISELEPLLLSGARIINVWWKYDDEVARALRENRDGVILKNPDGSVVVASTLTDQVDIRDGDFDIEKPLETLVVASYPDNMQAA